MTVKHKGNQEYEGLSTDTKPVASDTAVNATFAETDTGKLYRNNGTTWVLFSANDKTEAVTNKTIDQDLNTIKTLPGPPYKYVILKVGTTYKCKDIATGLYPSTSATFNTVLQYALDNSTMAAVGIMPGSYTFTSATSPLITWSKFLSWLMLSPGTEIYVPSGYNGVVWEIGGLVFFM